MRGEKKQYYYPIKNYCNYLIKSIEKEENRKKDILNK